MIPVAKVSIMTLTDVLVRAATLAPAQVVVHVDASGGEHAVTYAELYADALRVAAGMRREGLRAGDPFSCPMAAQLRA